ncbi:hypothetical protein D3C72_1553780 [compost metagenome]
MAGRAAASKPTATAMTGSHASPGAMRHACRFSCCIDSSKPTPAWPSSQPSAAPVNDSSKPCASSKRSSLPGEAPRVRRMARSVLRSSSAPYRATNSDRAATSSTPAAIARSTAMPTPSKLNSRAASKAGWAACRRGWPLTQRGRLMAARGDAYCTSTAVNSRWGAVAAGSSGSVSCTCHTEATGVTINRSSTVPVGARMPVTV